MSKIVKNITIFVIILAVLAVGFWWLLFYEPADNNQGDEVNIPEIEEVYRKPEEDVKRIELKLPDTTLVFKNGGNSWSIDGVNNDKISLSKVSGFISSVLNLYSGEKVTENTELCGFDNPNAVISVIGNDGKTDKITIGAKSAMADKYFFNVNGGDIHTMSLSGAETIMSDLSYYRSYKRFTINKDEIYDVEANYKITKTGETWLITKPFSAGYHINYDFINADILEPIAALELTTPVDTTKISTDSSYKPAVVTILSAPVLSDGTRGETVKTMLFIGKTEGDKVYVEYDGEVFLVNKSALSFASANEMYIVSKLLAITDVRTVKSVKIKADNEEYTLDVEHTAIATAEDETTFKLNGEYADTEKARQAYVEIISLQIDDRYKGQKTGKPIAEVAMDTTDGTKTLTFNRIDEFVSTFTVNGSTEFVIKNSKVEKMLDAFSKLLK